MAFTEKCKAQSVRVLALLLSTAPPAEIISREVTQTTHISQKHCFFTYIDVYFLGGNLGCWFRNVKKHKISSGAFSFFFFYFNGQYIDLLSTSVYPIASSAFMGFVFRWVVDAADSHGLAADRFAAKHWLVTLQFWNQLG